MSHWYDFGTVLPPAGLMVRLRRHPEHNPPYFGAFDIPTGIATSKVDIGYALLTPWQALTHWTVLQGSPGAWPQPHTGSTPWRDPFWTPPHRRPERLAPPPRHRHRLHNGELPSCPADLRHPRHPLAAPLVLRLEVETPLIQALLPPSPRP